MHVSMSAAMRGRMGKRAKEHREGAKAIPGRPPTSVSHMGETVTGNSLLQQLQGEMIKEWRNANQKSIPLSFHTSRCLPFIPSLNTKQNSWFNQWHCRSLGVKGYLQDLIGIKSYRRRVFLFPSRMNVETVWIIQDVEECCHRKFNQVVTFTFC